jgi:hypothetical protein
VVFWTSASGIDGENPVDLDELDLILIDPVPSSVWYQDMRWGSGLVRMGSAGSLGR